MVTKPLKSSQEDNGRHHKMTCNCLKNKQHFDNVVLDTKFQGSVEKIYNLLYSLLTDLENNDCMCNIFTKGKGYFDFNKYLHLKHLFRYKHRRID